MTPTANTDKNGSRSHLRKGKLIQNKGNNGKLTKRKERIEVEEIIIREDKKKVGEIIKSKQRNDIKNKGQRQSDRDGEDVK